VEFKTHPHQVSSLKKEWSYASTPFVGFHGLFRSELHFKWTSNPRITKLYFVADEPLSSTGFDRWSRFQPDNAGGNATHPGEDCGSMQTDGGLNDLNCASQVPFLCEQQIW